MCVVDLGISEVLGVVGAVASAASTAAGIQAKNKQADAEANAANQAAAADYGQETEQQNQINQQSAQARLQRAQEAMAQRSKLLVSSGEAGVGGSSPDKDQAESFMTESMDASTIESNRANKIAQVEAEKRKTQATAQGRINTAYGNMPSSVVAGLQIGASGLSGGLSGYTAGQQLTQ